jgi:transcriptional regulator with XRE-family HTH domain
MTYWTDWTEIDRHRARRLRHRLTFTQEHIGDLTRRSKSWVSNAERGVLDYTIPTDTLYPLAAAAALTDPHWLQPHSYPHDQLTTWIGAHVEASLNHVTFRATIVDVDGGFFHVVPDEEPAAGVLGGWRINFDGDSTLYLVPACNVSRRPEAWPDEEAGG